ncbi:hypothetical protein ACJJTC_017452 [Scirpophaga incertulas]
MKSSRQNGHVLINPPERFSFLPTDWAVWINRFKRYLQLSGQAEASNDDRINCLIYCMGGKAEEILLQFKKTDEYEVIVENFNNYFNPKKNVVFERFKFNSRKQNEDERVDDFITNLYKLSETCEYGDLTEELIRDRIVIELKEKKEKDAEYYNKRHRVHKLEELEINDRVWIIDLKMYGIVMEKCKQPRSYIVNTDRGKFRRNRFHLVKACKEIEREPHNSNYNVKIDEEYVDNSNSHVLDSQWKETNLNLNDSNSNLENWSIEPRQSKRHVKRPQYLKDYDCT